ncbi:hypothetical protein BDP55DRAFT_728294 [Colletotrichum godetiae]|uniref:Uncharacterized protein n=1 Tax=Colletotrichum godetiae TaxID=1209918 RepID=A0AAJ0ET90_9PEZI|nr:uncharacterized protein BDP55DRAFT_728294 [Colletotrichum godetiae]KAK1675936.1 hypothetical protein BDP55DRAFT_728294 [Colletotrichum godetiae]
MVNNNNLTYQGLKFVQYSEEEHEKLFNQLKADDKKKAKERRLEGKDFIDIFTTSREEALSELAHYQIRANKIAFAGKYEAAEFRTKVSEAYDEAHKSYVQAQEYYKHIDYFRKESEHKDGVIQQLQYEVVGLQAQLHQKTQEAADQHGQLDVLQAQLHQKTQQVEDQQGQLNDAVAKNKELLAQLDDVRKKVNRIMSTTGVLSPAASTEYDREGTMD